MARRLGWASLAGGVLVALFWAAYLSPLGHAARESPLVSAFEAAFPLADAVLALLLLGAGRALLTGHRTGPFLLVVAGAMCLHLGIVDLTFYHRLGLYSTLTPAGIVELVVNTLCIGGGAAGLRFGWALWGAR